MIGGVRTTKCEICEKDEDEVQFFTLKDPEQTLSLCREHYEMLRKNNRVTGKLVTRKCNACHQFIGYEWIAYKPSGRPRKGVKGNQKLDEFFDMRSTVERAINKKREPATVGDLLGLRRVGPQAGDGDEQARVQEGQAEEGEAQDRAEGAEASDPEEQ